MGSRAGRKVVKFEKTYTITVKGTVDTVNPEDYPWPLKFADTVLNGVVDNMNSGRKSTNVTITEERVK